VQQQQGRLTDAVLAQQQQVASALQFAALLDGELTSADPVLAGRAERLAALRAAASAAGETHRCAGQR
jgi:hypothetical protein